VDIVLSDPYEDGLRRILNFGHTIGHAIELLSDYAVRHGYAVSTGMISACLVAEAKLRFRETDKLIEVLDSIGLPTTLNHPPKDIIDVLYLDKKVWHGDIVMVLPKYIGKVIVMPVSEEDILRALERLES
jgi:3-dehydroquinate synthase